MDRNRIGHHGRTKDSSGEPGSMARGGSWRSRAAVAAAALLLATFVGSAGCGPDDLMEASPLSSARRSERALAEAVLRALEHRDRPGLEALLVTRGEHRDLLWPELPERAYFSFERARELNERNTRKAVQRAFERYGGRSFELVSLEYTKEREAYENFTLHRGARLRARDQATGQVATLEVLDVLVEMEGGWKLLNVEE